MILETTRDLYFAFLDGIKKEYTGTVVPAVFNRIWNDWAQTEWVRQNISLVEGVELTQKQIDDLSVLMVICNGIVPVLAGPLDPIAPMVGSQNIFELPDLPSGPTATPVGYFVDLPSYPAGISQYPRMIRFLSVAFKIQYIENECNLTGVSDWLDAKIMRSDKENHIMNSVYRKPKDSRLYYRRGNRNVQLITGTQSYGVAMQLQYIRWPRNIFFDATNQDDLATADYTPGNGSINCELPSEIRKEIVDIAVRLYLERVRDPRYQSYLNEVMMRNQANV
jgi:hypothetical protein